MSKKFDEYISPQSAEDGLKTGKYVSGVLRVNAKKPSDGFCVTGKFDILIKGKYDRNRAFNGDTIVVEIFPENQWHRTTKEDDIDSMDTTIGGELSITIPDGAKDDILLSALDYMKLSGTTASSSLGDKAPPSGVVKTGRVVYVANAVWKDRVYACSLQPNRMNEGGTNSGSMNTIKEDDKLIRAIPIDKRIPWILIQVNDIIKRMLKIPGNLDPNILYPVQVQKWAENGALPLGRIKGTAYGRVGEPEVEAKVCLAEAGLEAHENDFPSDVYEEVESMVSDFWNELENEAKQRIDLRKKRIFTIDPITARDLDDAIHIDVIDDEFVEVGVHIADVSHYVKEGSKVRANSTVLFYDETN
jgi:exoribonuclease R